MTLLPKPLKPNTTSDAIFRMLKANQDSDPRPHLGCSELGNKCERSLWYTFRWATKKEFEGRIIRLFSTGTREEGRLIAELRAIGAEIHDVDPVTKKQYRFEMFGGHVGGSMDAVGRGLPEGPKSWAVIEFKTHGSKSYADLIKKGVKESKPLHYVQMQMYMGLSGGIKRALYLGVNKDTDEIYSEWVHADEDCFKDNVAKAERVITASAPPSKISNDPSWFECKFCNHYDTCQTGKVARRNCRTCVFASAEQDGTWSCGKHKRTLVIEEQRVGCVDHLYIPALIPFAEATDTNDWTISYQDKVTEKVFVNAPETMPGSGSDPATFSSRELEGATSEMINNEALRFVKDELGGTIKQEEHKA